MIHDQKDSSFSASDLSVPVSRQRVPQLESLPLLISDFVIVASICSKLGTETVSQLPGLYNLVKLNKMPKEAYGLRCVNTAFLEPLLFESNTLVTISPPLKSFEDVRVWRREARCQFVGICTKRAQQLFGRSPQITRINKSHEQWKSNQTLEV